MSNSVIPWTVVPQAPLSVGCSRQEYWSGLPFLSPGDLADSGTEPASFTLAGRFFSTEPSGKPRLWLRDWFFRDNCLDNRWLTEFFSFKSTLTQRHIKRLYFPSLVNDTVIMVYALDRTVTVFCAFLLNSPIVSPSADGLLFQVSTFSPVDGVRLAVMQCLVCVAAVRPQNFTVQCEHRVLLLHLHRVLCVLLLVLIESLLLFRGEVAVPWVHTHS